MNTLDSTLKNQFGQNVVYSNDQYAIHRRYAESLPGYTFKSFDKEYTRLKRNLNARMSRLNRLKRNDNLSKNIDTVHNLKGFLKDNLFNDADIDVLMYTINAPVTGLLFVNPEVFETHITEMLKGANVALGARHKMIVAYQSNPSIVAKLNTVRVIDNPNYASDLYAATKEDDLFDLNTAGMDSSVVVMNLLKSVDSNNLERYTTILREAGISNDEVKSGNAKGMAVRKALMNYMAIETTNNNNMLRNEFGVDGRIKYGVGTVSGFLNYMTNNDFQYKGGSEINPIREVIAGKTTKPLSRPPRRKQKMGSPWNGVKIINEYEDDNIFIPSSYCCGEKCISKLFNDGFVYKKHMNGVSELSLRHIRKEYDIHLKNWPVFKHWELDHWVVDNTGAKSSHPTCEIVTIPTDCYDLTHAVLIKNKNVTIAYINEHVTIGLSTELNDDYKRLTSYPCVPKDAPVVVYDCETYRGSIYVNLSCQVSIEKTSDLDLIIENVSCMAGVGYKSIDFGTRHKLGEHAYEEMLEDLENFYGKDNKKIYLYAYNGGKFDTFLFEFLKNINYKKNITNGGIKQMIISRNDGSLLFDIRDLKDYTGLYLNAALRAYKIKALKFEFEIENYTKYMYEHPEDFKQHGYTWIAYMDQDVEVLYKLFESVNESLHDMGSDVRDSLTMSSLSWKFAAHMGNMMNTYIPTSPENISFIRSGIKGGRVQVYHRYFNSIGTNKPDRVYHRTNKHMDFLNVLDCNALYPTQMLKNTYADGKPRVIKDQADFESIKYTKKWEANLDILVPNTKRVLLPVSVEKNEKMYRADGSYLASDTCRLLYHCGKVTDTYFSEEALDVEARGYKIIKFNCGIVWPESTTIYSKVIKHGMKKKLQYAKEGNPAKQTVKVSQNSMYGINLLDIDTKIFFDDKPDTDIKDLICCGKPTSKLMPNGQYQHKINNIMSNKPSKPAHLGCEILAQARVHMNHFISKFPYESTYYGDTDSVYVKASEVYRDIFGSKGSIQKARTDTRDDITTMVSYGEIRNVDNVKDSFKDDLGEEYGQFKNDLMNEFLGVEIDIVEAIFIDSKRKFVLFSEPKWYKDDYGRLRSKWYNLTYVGLNLNKPEICKSTRLKKDSIIRMKESSNDGCALTDLINRVYGKDAHFIFGVYQSQFDGKEYSDSWREAMVVRSFMLDLYNNGTCHKSMKIEQEAWSRTGGLIKINKEATKEFKIDITAKGEYVNDDLIPFGYDINVPEYKQDHFVEPPSVPISIFNAMTLKRGRLDSKMPNYYIKISPEEQNIVVDSTDRYKTSSFVMDSEANILYKPNVSTVEEVTNKCYSLSEWLPNYRKATKYSSAEHQYVFAIGVYYHNGHAYYGNDNVWRCLDKVIDTYNKIDDIDKFIDIIEHMDSIVIKNAIEHIETSEVQDDIHINGMTEKIESIDFENHEESTNV